MGTRPDAYETSLQALRRRQPLLDAWLDAMNRLGGKSSRITTVRNIGFGGSATIAVVRPGYRASGTYVAISGHMPAQLQQRLVMRWTRSAGTKRAS
jgi:hypothetical protein